MGQTFHFYDWQFTLNENVLVSIDKKKKNFGSCDEDDQHDV
jgi:hypothetical protein